MSMIWKNKPPNPGARSLLSLHGKGLLLVSPGHVLQRKGEIDERAQPTGMSFSSRMPGAFRQICHDLGFVAKPGSQFFWNGFKDRAV